MDRIVFFLMFLIPLFALGCSDQPSTSTAKKINTDGMKDLLGGLKYRVLKEGAGATPTPNDRVEVHYRGQFLDGSEFDSSYKRGQPAVFPVTRVIKGWTEALQKMKEGDKWELLISPELAYGKSGMPPVIPPDSTLFFEVELLKVVK